MKAKQPKRDWLTISEAAASFGVSRQRMHQIVRKYDVPTTQINPRLSVVSKVALAKLEKDRKARNRG